jgi:translocation and assembly module TamA
MRRTLAVALMSLWLASPTALAAPRYHATLELDSRIEGLEQNLAQALDVMKYQHRQNYTEEDYLGWRSQLRNQIRDFFDQRGYYAPTVELDSDTDSQGIEHLLIRVQPGPRFDIRQVQLQFTGAILAAPASDTINPETLREAWSHSSGSVFRHSEWEAAKRQLVVAASAERYPLARISYSRATLDPATGIADLDVTLDSGPTFRLGTLVAVHGLQRYPADIFRRINPLQPGEPYSQARLLAYQQRLLNTGLVKTAEVRVQPRADGPLELPVTVTLEEMERRTLQSGVGYSTDYGPRISGTYTDRLFTADAIRYQVSTRLDASSQWLNNELVLPMTDHYRQDSVGLTLDHSDIQGQNLHSQTLYARRVWPDKTLERSFNGQLRFEHQQIDQGESSRNRALSATFSWTRRDLDSLIYPRRGSIWHWQSGGGISLQRGNLGFVRLFGRVNSYIPWFKRDSLLLRSEAGVVVANDRQGIPSDQLFRAGGDQSVRGYNYQSLGVASGSATVGGRYLLISSAEYTHWLTPRWGAAVFYDLGNAFDRIRDFKPARGYGAGVRWRSNIGPLNADIGFADRRDQYNLHFSIGFVF